MSIQNEKARLPEGADAWKPVKSALSKLVTQLSTGARRNVTVNHLNASLEVKEAMTIVLDPEGGFFAELKISNASGADERQNNGMLSAFGWEPPSATFPNYSRRFAPNATLEGIASTIVTTLTAVFSMNESSWFSLGQSSSDIALGDSVGLWKNKSAPWVRKLPPSKE